MINIILLLLLREELCTLKESIFGRVFYGVFYTNTI